jgi:hypothetical protein
MNYNLKIPASEVIEDVLRLVDCHIWCLDLADGSENNISQICDWGAPQNQGQRGKNNARNASPARNV